MKISLQRTLFEVINLVLAGLFVIPLGVLMEQLCGYPLYTCCLVTCLSALGHIGGRFSLKMPMGAAMAVCGASVAVAVALSFFLCPGIEVVTLLICLLTLFFSLFFFFSARKAGYTIHAPMTISGVLIHIFVLICSVGFAWPQEVNRFVSTIAIVFFLLTLFAMSAKGLRKSLHRSNGQKSVTYPAGMQMGNFLLVTGFIIIAAFISNIYPIFNLFSQLFSHVIGAIIAAFAFFISLFDRRSVSADIDEGVSQAVAEESILNAEPKGEAPWVTKAVEVFAFLIVLLLVIYAGFKVYQKLRQSGMKLPRFLQNLRDKFAPITEEDFVDETENLFDAKAMLKDTGERVKKALKRIRERPQRLDDFQDDRMKIRFTFQQLLKKVTLRDPRATAKTPNEIFSQEYAGESDFQEFMDYYNLARYSDTPLPEDAVSCAKGILKQKM